MAISSVMLPTHALPGENVEDELPLAKLGNFTFAQDIRKRVTEKRQAGVRAKRNNVLRRKSIGVDATTGLTTTTSIDIDSYITSDDMGQVLYADVGSHGYMAPEMIVPQKKESGSGSMNKQVGHC